MCTIRYAKQRYRIATGIKVKVDDWDADSQTLKKSSKGYLVVSSRIADIRLETANMIMKYELLEKTPGKADFRNIVHGEAEKNNFGGLTLLNYFDKYMGIRDKDTINYSKNTIKVYAKTRKKLGLFIGNRKLKLEDVNPEFVSSFINFLSESGISDKTINLVYLKNFKSFMNFALNQEWTANYKGAKIKLSHEREPNIALTMGELVLIMNFEPRNDAQRKVKTLFLLQCFQGLRISDVYGLTVDSFDLENDNLNFYDVKKGKWFKRPLLPMTRELFQKVISREGLHFVSESTYSIVIKEICKEAGLNRVEQVGRKFKGELISRLIPIHEKISSHHARATFITLSTEMGLLDEDIMLCTGITTPRTLLYYKRLKDENKVKRLKSKWNLENMQQTRQSEAS